MKKPVSKNRLAVSPPGEVLMRVEIKIKSKPEVRE
jgi:hypothetical protein